MLRKDSLVLLCMIGITFSQGCSLIPNSHSMEQLEKEKQQLEAEIQKKTQIQQLRDQSKALDANTAKMPADKTIEELTKDLSEAKKRKALEEELAKQTSDEDKRKKDFLGLNFGLGLAVTWDLTDRRIGNGAARDVNGVIRVDDDSNVFPRFVLESHYFFEGSWICSIMMDKKEDANSRCGVGPFVALETGNGSIINGVGAGIMHGFRYDNKSKSSWNIGIGAFIEPRVKVLGDGFSKNQPLPAGESSVRFKDSSLWSLMMLLSFSWNTFGSN